MSIDIQDNFVPNFNLKSPQRPEKPLWEDYEYNLEDNCPVCNLQIGIHKTRELVLCALNEIRGDHPKG